MKDLDEAIKHCKEVAEANRAHNVIVCTPNGELQHKRDADCDKCAEEHEQLAAWLEELKGIRELPADRKQFIADKIKEALPDITKRFEESLIESVPKIINSEIKCADCWCYATVKTNEREKTEADKWTPVSEPPKEHDYYLVTCEFGVARATDIALFYPDRKGEEQWSLNYVTAWKPLPEPYEQEEAT